MAFLKVPVRSDLPAYDFKIELDGVQYTLGFSYNARAGYWVMDIFDATDNPIVVGLRVITGWLLTNRFVMEGLPPGDFFVFDTSGKNQDPTIDNFGNTTLMMYADASEAAGG